MIPFNISCGSCWMCSRGLFAQCETTQNRATGKGASLFGYTELYGSVPGGQAEYLRVPQAHFGPIKVPRRPPGRAVPVPVRHPAHRVAGGEVRRPALPKARWRCSGSARSASSRPGSADTSGPSRVIGVDSVPERLEMARRHGIETLDTREVDNVAEALIELTAGRGPDGVIDAVGMEAHDSPAGKVAHTVVAALPDALANPLADKMAVDRLGALHTAVKAVRRGGTVSVSGVYGGEVDPMPVMEMFDRGITMRMGQCHVKRWIDGILPAVMDDSDPLGTLDMTTHHLPLDQAPQGYEIFQKKQDGCIKVVLNP